MCGQGLCTTYRSAILKTTPGSFVLVKPLRSVFTTDYNDIPLIALLHASHFQLQRIITNIQTRLKSFTYLRFIKFCPFCKK